MIFDLVWLAGEVLGVVILLSGACLVLMETGPFLLLFNKKSAAPLSLLPSDLRLICGSSRHGISCRFLIGNSAIDTQHQVLCDGVNQLRTTILSGQSVEEMSAAVDALIHEVGRHFQDEEAMLVAAGYPDAERHAATHREILHTASTLAGEFRAGRLGKGDLFRSLVHDTLAREIQDTDREFVPYLEGRLAMQQTAS